MYHVFYNGDKGEVTTIQSSIYEFIKKKKNPQYMICILWLAKVGSVIYLMHILAT